MPPLQPVAPDDPVNVLRGQAIDGGELVDVVAAVLVADLFVALQAAEVLQVRPGDALALELDHEPVYDRTGGGRPYALRQGQVCPGDALGRLTAAGDELPLYADGGAPRCLGRGSVNSDVVRHVKALAAEDITEAPNDAQAGSRSEIINDELKNAADCIPVVTPAGQLPLLRGVRQV